MCQVPNATQKTISIKVAIPNFCLGCAAEGVTGIAVIGCPPCAAANAAARGGGGGGGGGAVSLCNGVGRLRRNFEPAKLGGLSDAADSGAAAAGATGVAGAAGVAVTIGAACAIGSAGADPGEVARINSFAN